MLAYGTSDPLYSLSDRVNYMLARRIELLDQVELLADSINYNVFQEYTCERADLFFKNHLKPLWESSADFPFVSFIKTILQSDEDKDFDFEGQK